MSFLPILSPDLASPVFSRRCHGLSARKNAGFLLQLSAVNADQLRYYGYFLLVLGIFFVWSARP